MESLKWVLFALIIVSATTIAAASEAMGKKAKVNIDSGSTCKVDRKEDKSSVLVRDISDTKRAINMTLEFVADLDDKQMTVIAVADKLVGGIWQKDFMTYTGPACKTIVDYLPGIVKKISAASTPKLDIKCPWKKGVYVIKNLENMYQPDDTKLPSYPYGRIRINFTVKDKSKKTLICLTAEADVQKP